MLVLSTHPECDKLAGPCPRCGRYFLRKTVKQKVYCSRNCGSLASARASTLKRRNDEHAQKLLRASEAAAMWNPQNTRRGWKEFVSSKHPDMTPKFLTRAVNRGELHDPTVFQQKAVTARKGANKNA
jgi:hypothetical protein